MPRHRGLWRRSRKEDEEDEEDADGVSENDGVDS
jgi:hypothetical protein